MNRTTVRTAIIVSLTVLLFNIATSQGMYWETMTRISVMGEDTVHSKMYYMPGMMKEESEKRNTSTIIRIDKQLIISVNNKEKTYSEMTFEELESTIKKAGGMMNEKMKDMEEALKNMPEEQRKMMEKMMGDAMPGKSKGGAVGVTTTSKTKKISGFLCSEFVATLNGKPFMTIWATKDISGYDGMKKDLREFSQRLAAMIPIAGKSIADAMKSVEGFPIQTEIQDRMNSTVTTVEKQAISSSIFEIPSGYTKVKPAILEE